MKKAPHSPHPQSSTSLGAAELARGHWAEAAHLSSASLAQLDRGPLPEPTSWMARQVLGCPDYQPVAGTWDSQVWEGRDQVCPIHHSWHIVGAR